MSSVVNSLKDLIKTYDAEDYNITIKFDKVEEIVTEKDRYLSLFSKINFTSNQFSWNGVVETAHIPYKDEAVGYFIDGAIRSSVSIYQRAPGPVFKDDTKSKKNSVYGTLDIINIMNGKLSISDEKDGIFIALSSGGKIPIGIFLKAISEMPYRQIMDNIAYLPKELRNSFPPIINNDKGSLSKLTTSKYGDKEPTLEECVDAVYNAMLAQQKRGSVLKNNTTFYYKYNRIKTYLNNLNYKNRDNIEAKLSVGHRAVGSKLVDDINIPVFAEDGSVTSFFIPKGTHITDKHAREIRRHDITCLRIENERIVTIQDESSMYFRVLGYKLGEQVGDFEIGTYINEEVLKSLNETSMLTLKVITPNGSKYVTRSNDKVTYSDFITILNYYLTAQSTKVSDSSEYSINNRVIVSFDNTILNTISDLYEKIIDSLVGVTNIREILNALRVYPDVSLMRVLRSAERKEVTQPDLTNLLSKETTERKSSALMKEASVSMQYIQDGQYGRIDSLHAPQSEKIGAVNQLTVMAKIKEGTGEILTPYERVINGVPTGEIENISAAKEKNKYIAEWNDDLSGNEITVRVNGDITVVGRQQVDYREVSPFLDMSLSRALVPFPDYSQPKRSLMATTHQCQSVPLLNPERALVTTGADTEVPCLYYTAKELLEMYGIQSNSHDKLKIVKVDWTKTSANYRFSYGSNLFVHHNPCIVSDKETLYMYRLNIKKNDVYDEDDIVFYYFSTDTRDVETWELMEQGTIPFVKDPRKPAIALGKNLRIGYKTSGSSTIDDAVLISRRLVTDETLTSIQIFKYKYKLKANESFAQYNAIASLHSWVSSGEPVITVTKANNNIKEINAFITGEVIFVERTDDSALVYIATYHRADIGDKIAGRYGNKSVIAKIVDEEMMPYDPETGETLDMCLSPLGLPSRMNYGQLLEVAIGAVMSKEKKIAVITPYYPNSKEKIIDKCKEHNIIPKRLYLPMFNKYTERPIMVGIMYILKLEQMANLKASAVGYPVSVDPVFGQPTASDNEDKGQKIGEMETWVLGACGMYHLLDDFFSFYVDDNQLREKYFAALDDGPDGPWNELKESIKTNRSPSRNSLVTQSIIRSLGLDIEPDKDYFHIVPIDMSNISHIVTKNTLLQHNNSQWSKIELQSPIVSPFWLEKMSTMKFVLNVPSISAILDEKDYINQETLECVKKSDLPETTKTGYISGLDAIIHILQNTSIDSVITRLNKQLEHIAKEDEGTDNLEIISLSKNTYVEYKQLRDFLIYLRDKGYNLDIFILREYPVLPGIFRQSLMGQNNKQIVHSFNKQLLSVINAVHSKDIYRAVKDFIGYGSDKSKDTSSIANFFMGKDSEGHGRMRDSVLSKRIGFSGRAVIVPADANMSPFFIGLPWYLAVNMYDRLLALKFIRYANDIADEMVQCCDYSTPINILHLSEDDWVKIIVSLWSFNFSAINKYIHSTQEQCRTFYNILRRYAKKFIEGNVTKDGRVLVNGEYVNPDNLPLETNIDASVVLFGRQPTLHKKSIRSYFVQLVDGWSIHIHPLVCSEYNADFDGDTMWVAAVFGESKIEALQKMSIDKDLIADKDGSFTLGLHQDICLGLYCMTTYKDNTPNLVKDNTQLYYYDNIQQLRTDIEYGTLHYYDCVLYLHPNGNCYLSTAGRILTNSVIPNAFTENPFTDKHNIAKLFGIIVFDKLKDLLFDDLFASREQPGNISYVKIDNIVEYVFANSTPKETISICQELYEMGLIASDTYGVSISIFDLSNDIDISLPMEAAKSESNEASLLYHMGLITLDESRAISKSIWDNTKTNTQKTIMKSLEPTNNLYYMLYSGARGNAGQIMQTIGFVGTIQKTTTSDIERPILHGYGNGLTSFDISQTLYSARIGVVATQLETKTTGYATRQAAYIVMGDNIVEDDCGIPNSVVDVEWSKDIMFINTETKERVSASELYGSIIVDNSNDNSLRRIYKEISKCSYIFRESIVNAMLNNNIKNITLNNTVYTLSLTLSSDSKEKLLGMYSYALPYLDEDFKITEKTLSYIEEFNLNSVIALDTNDSLLHLEKLEEAYLPVDYDSEQYNVYIIKDGREKKVDISILLTLDIIPSSAEYYTYKNLLTENRLNLQALKYITEHKIRKIDCSNDITVYIKYKIKKVFQNLVIGRVSCCLPNLNQLSLITPETLSVVQDKQILYIPVRTGFTCKSENGMCSKCFGVINKENRFKTVGENIGIAAAQSMCESATQTTMNTTHNAGKRNGNLEQGVKFFMNLLQGKSVKQEMKDALERYANTSGYLRYEQLNKDIVSIVDDSGKILEKVSGGYQRWALPDGAYVNSKDVLISGVPNLQRFASKDIFLSSLQTRYLMVTIYNIVFNNSGLDISPRNFEVLARAQTSQVYLVDSVDLPPIKDTSTEIKDKTGHYMLIVSSHYDIIHKFIGIGFLGFERFNDMFKKAILFPEQNKMSSFVSNFLTGTEIGSKEIVFKPSVFKTNKTSKNYNRVMVDTMTVATSDSFNLFEDLRSSSNEEIINNNVDNINPNSEVVVNSETEKQSDTVSEDLNSLKQLLF